MKFIKSSLIFAQCLIFLLVSPFITAYSETETLYDWEQKDIIWNLIDLGNINIYPNNGTGSISRVYNINLEATPLLKLQCNSSYGTWNYEIAGLNGESFISKEFCDPVESVDLTEIFRENDCTFTLKINFHGTYSFIWSYPIFIKAGEIIVEDFNDNGEWQPKLTDNPPYEIDNGKLVLHQAYIEDPAVYKKFAVDITKTPIFVLVADKYDDLSVCLVSGDEKIDLNFDNSTAIDLRGYMDFKGQIYTLELRNNSKEIINIEDIRFEDISYLTVLTLIDTAVKALEENTAPFENSDLIKEAINFGNQMLQSKTVDLPARLNFINELESLLSSKPDTNECVINYSLSDKNGNPLSYNNIPPNSEIDLTITVNNAPFNFTLFAGVYNGQTLEDKDIIAIDTGIQSYRVTLKSPSDNGNYELKIISFTGFPYLIPLGFTVNY